VPTKSPGRFDALAPLLYTGNTRRKDNGLC
jgi:hypothetical protein